MLNRRDFRPTSCPAWLGARSGSRAPFHHAFFNVEPTWKVTSTRDISAIYKETHKRRVYCASISRLCKANYRRSMSMIGGGTPLLAVLDQPLTFPRIPSAECDVWVQEECHHRAGTYGV